MNKVYKKMMLSMICLALLGAVNLNAQNLLGNGSFETGELAPWTAGNNNTVNIIEDAHDGMYAAQGNIEQLVQVEAGTEYTYTAMVKCLGSCGTDPMWIGIKDVTGDMFVANFGFTDQTEYSLASITFTAGTTGTHRFWVFGQGAADYVADSLVLLAEGTTLVSNDDLEPESNKIQITNSLESVKITIDDSIREANVQVHDISGKLIYDNTIGNGTSYINNSEFKATGIYVVSVRNKNTLKVEQISILK